MFGRKAGYVFDEERFCGRSGGIKRRAFSLKQHACPHCGRRGTLNRHSVLRGNDPAVVNGSVARGQRVFCSNRSQRSGCGKTFPLFLASVLPRHTFTAGLLWALLRKLLGGATLRASAEALRLPFSLEAVYGIVRRLRHRLAAVRSSLCRQQPAPASTQTDPLHQTLEHLQCLCPQNTCALAAYQRHFQRAFLR